MRIYCYVGFRGGGGGVLPKITFFGGPHIEDYNHYCRGGSILESPIYASYHKKSRE